MRNFITVSTTVNIPIEQAWTIFTTPKHVIEWNAASADWHTTSAENDLSVGGTFSYRMEARDGSFGFDFFGVYDVVEHHKFIQYTLGDNRKVEITFTPIESVTKITEVFEAETENAIELQQYGWQMILDNFKAYAERIS